MPRVPPRSRDSLSKRPLPSQRRWMLLGGAAVSLLLIVVAILMAFSRGRITASATAKLIAAWRDGDTALRQARYDEAARAYEKLVSIVESGGAPTSCDTDCALAEAIISVCKTCEKWQPRLRPGGVLDDGDALVMTGQLRRLRETSPASVVVPDNVAIGGQASGRTFTPEERCRVIAEQLLRHADRVLASSALGSTDDAATCKLVRTLADLARHQGVSGTMLEGIEKQVEQRTRELERRGDFQKMVTACDDCLGNPTAKALLSAEQQFERFIKANPGDTAAISHWDRFRGQLATELQQRVVVTPNHTSRTQPTPAGGPTLLPREVASSWSATKDEGVTSTDAPLVFAPVADRCVALDAVTGHVRWIVRIGYDSTPAPSWLSSDVGPVVVLVWHEGGEPVVSVLDAADGHARWNLHLPSDARIVGPIQFLPTATPNRMLLPLANGELWQVALDGGTVQQRMEFPEPLGGALILDESGERLFALGQELAGYMLRVVPDLALQSVVTLPRDEGAEEAWGFWSSPLLILVRNTTYDTCRLHVLRERADQQMLEPLDQRSIPGRIWQPPVTYQNQMLLMTDIGEEVIYGVDVNDEKQALYELQVVRSRNRRVTEHTVYDSYADRGFVVVRSGRLECWSLDALGVTGAQRRENWPAQELLANMVPLFRPQRVEQKLVTVGRRPGHSEVMAVAFRISDGTELWRTVLGDSATALLDHRIQSAPQARAFVQTGHHGWQSFRVAPNGTWNAIPIKDLLGMNATLDVAMAARRWFWIRAQASPTVRQLVIATADGKLERSWPLSADAASPAAGCEGALVTVDDSETEPGLWIAFVDASARLILAQGHRPDLPPQIHDLPSNIPRDGWYRPVWVKNQGVLLAHPAGQLMAGLARIDGGVPYLARSGDGHVLAAGLAGPPVQVADQSWVVDRSGVMRTQSWPTLTVLGELQLPAPPSTPLTSAEPLAIGLQTGQVVIVESAVGPPRLRQVYDVGPEPIMFVTSQGGQVVAVDRRGQVFAIDDIARPLGIASALPSVPPLIWYDTVFVLTESGSVESWRLSNSTAANP